MGLVIKIFVAIAVVLLAVGLVAAVVLGVSGGARRHSLPPTDPREGQNAPGQAR